jgi:hypothetical protein
MFSQLEVAVIPDARRASNPGIHFDFEPLHRLKNTIKRDSGSHPLPRVRNDETFESSRPVIPA